MEATLRSRYLNLFGITQWKERKFEKFSGESLFVLELEYHAEFGQLLHLSHFAKEHWWLAINDYALLEKPIYQQLLNNILLCCGRKLGSMIELNKSSLGNNVDKLLLVDHCKEVDYLTEKASTVFILPALNKLIDSPTEKHKLWQRLIALFDVNNSENGSGN